MKTGRRSAKKPLFIVLLSGTDADMLRGNTLGTLVDNRHISELSDLANIEGIHFSEASFAEGILDAMAHYGFPTLENERS